MLRFSLPLKKALALAPRGAKVLKVSAAAAPLSSLASRLSGRAGTKASVISAGNKKKTTSVAGALKVKPSTPLSRTTNARKQSMKPRRTTQKIDSPNPGKKPKMATVKKGSAGKKQKVTSASKRNPRKMEKPSKFIPKKKQKKVSVKKNVDPSSTAVEGPQPPQTFVPAVAKSVAPLSHHFVPAAEEVVETEAHVAVPADEEVVQEAEASFAAATSTTEKPGEEVSVGPDGPAAPAVPPASSELQTE
jgi:hypothetical protein